MICNLCGKELPDGALYCDSCGNTFARPQDAPEDVEIEILSEEVPAGENADGADTLSSAAPESAAEEGADFDIEIEGGIQDWSEDAPQGETAPDGALSSEAPRTEAPAAEEVYTPPVYVPKQIKSHMALAVVTTVLLFNWILGIPAIIFARECELAAEKGQLEIAERFSRRSAAFALVGVGLTLALAAFVTLVIVVMRAAAPALLTNFY